MTGFTVSWGIIGTGWIASKFVADITAGDPATSEIRHSVVAVASRDLSKSEEFIAQHFPSAAEDAAAQAHTVPKAYGSYAELYADKTVTVVYIATLHPFHYAETRRALMANKHSLVEKPATLNGAEWADLSALAKARKLFLMEGMWTSFLPIMSRLRKALLEDKAIGEIRGVQATFGMNLDAAPAHHRVLARETAGGALMDLGPYAILPTLLALYDNPDNGQGGPEQVSSAMLIGSTGVDATTSLTMTFPKIRAIGIATVSIAMTSSKENRCTILGTDGEIQIHDGLSRITKFTIKRTVSPNFPLQWLPDEIVEAPLQGFGLVHEANHVAYCIRDGLLESAVWPHSKTKLMMGLIDTVRKQNGYAFQEGLEQIQST